MTWREVLDRIAVISPPQFLPISRLWDLQFTYLAVLQMHWHSGAPPGVASSGTVFETRNPGINPRGIMCLFDGVVLGVQAPREEPLEEAALYSFFGGAGL